MEYFEDERDTKRKKKNGEIEERTKKNVTDWKKVENQSRPTTKNREDEKKKKKKKKRKKNTPKTVSKLLIRIFSSLSSY